MRRLRDRVAGLEAENDDLRSQLDAVRAVLITAGTCIRRYENATPEETAAITATVAALYESLRWRDGDDGEPQEADRQDEGDDPIQGAARSV